MNTAESATALTDTTAGEARNKIAPSNARIEAVSFSIPNRLFGTRLERGSVGELDGRARVNSNGWTVTGGQPITITEDIDETDTGSIVLDHEFEFTPPAGASDATPNLTATETITRINSFRYGYFTEGTIDATMLNTLANWTVTGDDTESSISGSSYTVSTVVGRYTHFAIPTTIGTPVFFENGQSVALQAGVVVGAYTIYRSRNVARLAQTVTYTITF